MEITPGEEYLSDHPDKPDDKTKNQVIKGVTGALGGAQKGSAKASEGAQKAADKASSEHADMPEAKAAPAITGATLGSFKHGGDVPKTGEYKLHKGEKVVPNQKDAPKGMYREVYEMRQKMKDEEK